MEVRTPHFLKSADHMIRLVFYVDDQENEKIASKVKSMDIEGGNKKGGKELLHLFSYLSYNSHYTTAVNNLV